MLKLLTTLHKCTKYSDIWIPERFAETCKNKVSCLKKHGGWLICVAMKNQKRIYLHNTQKTVHQPKKRLSDYFTYHSLMIVLGPLGDTAFQKKLGWRLLSPCFRWQREHKHTARAVLLPVFNNPEWLQWAKSAKHDFTESDHLLMRWHAIWKKIGVTNLWINDTVLNYNRFMKCEHDWYDLGLLSLPMNKRFKNKLAELEKSFRSLTMAVE